MISLTMLLKVPTLGNLSSGTTSAGAVLFQLYECADHSSPDWEGGGVYWGGGGGMLLDADALSSSERGSATATLWNSPPLDSSRKLRTALFCGVN